MKHLLALAFTLLLLPSLSWAQAVLGPAANPGQPGLEVAVESTTATMVNNNVVFTVVGGPIHIINILSVCVTANDATASTMQWRSNPTVGTATTFSGASATLASATAGTTVQLAPTALSTAPVIVAASAGGVQLGTNVANRIVVNNGTIQLVIGVGSTTGTWKHYLRYQPLTLAATVR